jgi:gamma-glutamyltranspeptidase
MPSPATFVLEDGIPAMALSANGNIHCTIPQILQRIIDFDATPEAALAAPRLTPIDEHYGISMEAGLGVSEMEVLARLGVQIRPLRSCEPEMGAASLCWRTGASGVHAVRDPRSDDRDTAS